MVLNTSINDNRLIPSKCWIGSSIKIVLNVVFFSLNTLERLTIKSQV